MASLYNTSIRYASDIAENLGHLQLFGNYLDSADICNLLHCM